MAAILQGTSASMLHDELSSPAFFSGVAQLLLAVPVPVALLPL